MPTDAKVFFDIQLAPLAFAFISIGVQSCLSLSLSVSFSLSLYLSRSEKYPYTAFYNLIVDTDSILYAS